ncbi:MAG: hypothetical protein AABX80_02355 [Nanoarchaeota archaeon]
MNNYKSLIEKIKKNKYPLKSEDLDDSVCGFCYYGDSRAANKLTNALSSTYSKFFPNREVAYTTAMGQIDFICFLFDFSTIPKKCSEFQKFYRKAVNYNKKINVNLN